VIVVDRAASALETASGTAVSDQVLRLAEQAAGALNADLVAIDIALRSGEPVVWDARPVPDFRDAMPITDLTVAQVIAQAVDRRLGTVVPGGSVRRDPTWPGIATRAQGHGWQRDLVISA
jgi:hypothetical protein